MLWFKYGLGVEAFSKRQAVSWQVAAALRPSRALAGGCPGSPDWGMPSGRIFMLHCADVFMLPRRHVFSACGSIVLAMLFSNIGRGQLSDSETAPRAPISFTINGQVFELRWIPAGDFVMGATEQFKDRYKAVQPVRLTRGYWMGSTEMTWEQFHAALPDVELPSQWDGPNMPVTKITWFECVALCAKLNQSQKRLIPAGYQFRPPTEAEWERAARAGSTGDYAGDLDEMAWYDKTSGNRAHAVGLKKPNAYGLYDMHGNVWEWCYDKTYWVYDASKLAIDPSGPNDYEPSAADIKHSPPTGHAHVYRSGQYGQSAAVMAAARRDGNRPILRSNHIGFRLSLGPQLPMPVKTVPEK